MIEEPVATTTPVAPQTSASELVVPITLPKGTSHEIVIRIALKIEE
jgi:hypothetical protein